MRAEKRTCWRTRPFFTITSAFARLQYTNALSHPWSGYTGLEICMGPRIGPLMKLQSPLGKPSSDCPASCCTADSSSFHLAVFRAPLTCVTAEARFEAKEQKSKKGANIARISEMRATAASLKSTALGAVDGARRTLAAVDSFSRFLKYKD